MNDSFYEAMIKRGYSRREFCRSVQFSLRRSGLRLLLFLKLHRRWKTNHGYR